MTSPSLDLAAIRARAEKATPGPWNHGGSASDATNGYTDEWVWEGTGHPIGDPDAPDTRICSASAADASFIAHARTDIPALLEEVERLQDEITLAKGCLVSIQSHPIRKRLDYALAEMLRLRGLIRNAATKGGSGLCPWCACFIVMAHDHELDCPIKDIVGSA